MDIIICIVNSTRPCLIQKLWIPDLHIFITTSIFISGITSVIALADDKRSLKRQIHSQNVLNLIRAFSNIDRQSLLPYKEKKQIENNFISFNIYFDKSFLNFNDFIKKTWQNILPSNLYY